MKHTSSKIMLLVAGALALTYFLKWVSFFLSVFILPNLAMRSGGIGSVSVYFSPWDPVLAAILWFAPSFLLWRACAGLAAGGDQVMAWHRRFHGWAVIAGLLLILSIVGIGALALRFASPEALDAEWFWFLMSAVYALVVASCGLNVMQLVSVATAFKILRRATSEPSIP
jgi:hypothetical protein